jgi:hypothetical protein
MGSFGAHTVCARPVGAPVVTGNEERAAIDNAAPNFLD